MTKKVSRIVLSVVASYGLATCQGCSYLAVHPAPVAFERGAPIRCTTNRAAPVIDTIFTASHVGSAFYLTTQSQKREAGALVGLELAVAGLWMSSAIYGYKKTSECEALLAERDDDTPYRPANYVVVPGRPYGQVPAPPQSFGPPAPPATPPALTAPRSPTLSPKAPPPPGPPVPQNADDEIP